MCKSGNNNAALPFPLPLPSSDQFPLIPPQPDLIREIIEQYGADPNLKARYSCKTALHIAAKKGYIRCAEVLLELGGNTAQPSHKLNTKSVSFSPAGSLRCFDHSRRPPQLLARSAETVAVFAPFVIQMREQVSPESQPQTRHLFPPPYP